MQAKRKGALDSSAVQCSHYRKISRASGRDQSDSTSKMRFNRARPPSAKTLVTLLIFVQLRLCDASATLLVKALYQGLNVLHGDKREPPPFCTTTEKSDEGAIYSHSHR